MIGGPVPAGRDEYAQDVTGGLYVVVLLWGVIPNVLGTRHVYPSRTQP